MKIIFIITSFLTTFSSLTWASEIIDHNLIINIIKNNNPLRKKTMNKINHVINQTKHNRCINKELSMMGAGFTGCSMVALYNLREPELAVLNLSLTTAASFSLLTCGLFAYVQGEKWLKNDNDLIKWQNIYAYLTKSPQHHKTFTRKEVQELNSFLLSKIEHAKVQRNGSYTQIEFKQ